MNPTDYMVKHVQYTPSIYQTRTSCHKSFASLLSITTEQSNQTPAGAKNTNNSKSLSHGKLQRPSKRGRQEQNGQVADHTDKGISSDDSVLIKAIFHLAHPIGAYGSADKNLDEETRYVIGDQHANENVDSYRSFLVDCAEDADCNEEEGEFDTESHRSVEDGGCVAALDVLVLGWIGMLLVTYLEEGCQILWADFPLILTGTIFTSQTKLVRIF